MITPLLTKLPASRAADWGCKVTICIAMLCNRRQSILQISDHKVSFGTDFSADNAALKDVPFLQNTSALVAGNDVEHAKPILKRALEIIISGKNEAPEAVADAVDEAYGERLNREISNRVLRKRGFTVESFVEKGKQKCTPSVYLSICNRIDQIKLSLRFLISGFDEEGRGHIFCVDGDGAPKCYDDVGMWAIGTGAHAALSSLAFHTHRRDLAGEITEQEAVYFGLAAKFMAESSNDVGEATFLTMHSLNTIKYLGVPVNSIREVWENEGRPRCPDDLKTRLDGILKTRQEIKAARQLAAQTSKPEQ